MSNLQSYFSRLFLISTLLCTACTPALKLKTARVNTPDVSGPEINVQSLNQGQTQNLTLSNGAEITVQRMGEQAYHEIEGTFTTDAFTIIQSSIAQKTEAERKEILEQEVEAIFKSAAKIGALPMRSTPSMGYFQMMIPYEPQVFSAMKTIALGDHRSIIVQPIVRNTSELKRIQEISSLMSEDGALPNLRSGTRGFSGLERIGAPAFVKEAERDIGGGVKVDGSSVQVGVTDTGITYNHPTFLSAITRKNRINHIADSTGEGTVYISPAASFSASAVEGSGDTVAIKTQLIITPKLPALPSGDDMKAVDGFKIKVSAEIRALLLAPNASGAKLGLIQEKVIGSESEPVDMNHNGKTDDQLFVLYFPAQGDDAERVYFDSTGTRDFRKSVALRDFNSTHDTMPVFAERIGFAFNNARLPTKTASETVIVRTVDFVGFDAGNHGSHVSGIIAGSKTIANDSDSTLARGVAPEAQIAMNRVCSNNAGCSELGGLMDLVTNTSVDVINMSLGGLSPFNDGAGVGETLINRLVSIKNVAFMISAGNSGPGHQTIGSPSTARLAMSIGATASKSLIQRQYQWPGLGTSPATSADDDFMLFFSSRGPTASGGFKPMLSAPGTELSSVQLNAAPGLRGGLAVYWGTSMAAPSATGAYALFLDAIRKYNLRYPNNALPTDAMTLRRVLLESARPFDANRLDVESGVHTSGQYTWADEGVGMIDLPAAWKLIFAVRDSMPASPVVLDGKSVELDYEVLISAKEPNGIAYDGSRIVNNSPVFASGIYLSSSDPETMKQVNIARRLPEAFASSASAGDLTRQLETTADEFVLKTVIFGSDQAWLKAGVMESPNCADSSAADITILGEGAAVGITPATESSPAKGFLTPIGASGLNVCIDKSKTSALAPGDHGALIYAYRKVGNQTSPIASFIVPVYLNVPEKVMAASASVDYSGSVTSFGVDRHYVQVPPGTSVLRISLEVPPVKVNGQGFIPADEICSGIELMAYKGVNTEGVFDSRAKARIQNCTGNGAPTNDASKRTLNFTETNPQSGLWDIHVFGQYRYAQSKYRLRVDYVSGRTSVKEISGGLAALQGTLQWSIRDSSIAALPDSEKSLYELTGLRAEFFSEVSQGNTVSVESPLGLMRSYPAGIQSVVIATGSSPGNDIDLYVIGCPSDAVAPADPRCVPIGASTGPTDREAVEFVPAPGMKYAVQINGATIKGSGDFVSSETLKFEPEKGVVQVNGSAPNFSVGYSFDVKASALMSHELFTSGKYSASGSLSIRMADETVLTGVPVSVKNY